MQCLGGPTLSANSPRCILQVPRPLRLFVLKARIHLSPKRYEIRLMRHSLIKVSRPPSGHPRATVQSAIFAALLPRDISTIPLLWHFFPPLYFTTRAQDYSYYMISSRSLYTVYIRQIKILTNTDYFWMYNLVLFNIFLHSNFILILIQLLLIQLPIIANYQLVDLWHINTYKYYIIFTNKVINVQM